MQATAHHHAQPSKGTSLPTYHTSDIVRPVELNALCISVCSPTQGASMPLLLFSPF